jgi:hypothetical protein
VINVILYRGKRIEELTHDECLVAIRQMMNEVNRLTALMPYVDFRQKARDMMNANKGGKQ